MTVSIRSFNSILGGMVRKILADTTLSDMRVGSVISSILEAAAQSDFEIHASIVQLLQLFNIDTTEGADLDRRAAEFNVIRRTANLATDVVTVGDKSFTKKSSKIYIGLPPPVVGDVTINVEDASEFPSVGKVYVGRGTGNYEGPISYTSLTNNTSYWSINLSSPIAKNHTAAETVILSQGGNRIINTGITVMSPANNFSPAVYFTVIRAVTLVDGETSITGVSVTAKVQGTVGNVPAGSIVQFAAAPFTGATVTNPSSFTNGQDVELDPSLRNRIRATIQLMARGTKNSILQAVIGVSDQTDNKRVVSASLSEPVNSSIPAQLYIDDGTGFEPSIAGQGVERIVNEAAGSEQRIQVANFPVTPPILVTTIDQPFGLQPDQTLTYRVDKTQETITFLASDFSVPGLVKASEIIDAINSKSTLVQARSFRNKTAVALVANRFFDGTDPEELQIVGGDANDSLQFPVTTSRVMSLYQNGSLLKKNPQLAIVNTTARNVWTFGTSTIAVRFVIAVDNTPIQDVVFRDSDFTQYGTTYKTATVAQWAEQITQKISGVTAAIDLLSIRVSSNRTNSSDSQIDVYLASDLASRETTDATWRVGNTVRYTVANTNGIIVGDSVTVFGFPTPSNNGIFPVTRVAESDYVECTTPRTDGTDDETVGPGVATINPNKEDLALVAFGGTASSVGSTSDYTLNRFSGEIELASRLSSGDEITAGSQFTKAYVDSVPGVNNLYNFPVQQDVNPAIFVSIDSSCAVRFILVTSGDTITQGRVGATDNVQLQSNRANAFLDSAVGDFVYISTKSTSGIGPGYSAWFPSYATGVYEIAQVIDGETVYIRNPDPLYPTLPSVVTGTVSDTTDVQIFQTDGLVQKIALSGINLLPTAVATLVNASVQFSEAIVFNNKLIRLQSNSFDEAVSKVFILATAGSGSNLYTAGMYSVAQQPHIGFQLSDTNTATFPKLKDGLAGLFPNYKARGMLFGVATSSSLVQPYANIDSTKTFTADVKINDLIKYSSGNNNQQLLALRSIDSNVQLTPQAYSGIKPIFAGDNYLVSESYKFSPYDQLIIELDQDSTNKTFLVPMYRTGRVKGIATTSTFDAYDMDSAPGTDFNNATWQGFDFQDFAMTFRSRNIYKSSASDSALVIRSAVYGKVGDNVRFGIFYPAAANLSAYATHLVSSGQTSVNFFLSSGPGRIGISNVGTGYLVGRVGNDVTITYAGVGVSPNFATNGVLPGDIASISDSSFANKSSLFIGSGKVISASDTQMVVKFFGTATLSTSYAATAVQDAGTGSTSKYLMPATGVLSIGDTVQVSGFARSINNGTFVVSSVALNTSVTVSHSIRTTITAATNGYRRTSNLVSLQFVSSVTGQVFVSDQVVISNLIDPTLNGTYTVSSLLTTVFTNDTIQYTASGSDIPLAKTVTSALWQIGNTVRYACANTTGINIGNSVLIAGFSNSDNNGTLLVTNKSNNNWIEVTSTRSNATNDEVGPVAGTARPTYFSTDTSGVVKVLNAETTAATVKLVVVQVSSVGIAAFSLGGTTASDVSSTLLANPIIKRVITSVNALGYMGTGIITNSTFDELGSVGYNHTPGDSYVNLYDGNNFVLDFYSATVNPFKNFFIKESLQFSHPDYDISTVPNVTGEQPGEYFRLVPTTFRNIEGWFNKPSVTSLSIVGNTAVTSAGKVQLSSQTIGTSGAVQVTGGSGNGIESFINTPASVDAGAIKLQVNNSDTVMFVANQVVQVANVLPSRKANNFTILDQVDVETINGTTGKFKAHARSLTLSGTNTVTITDVSASYGRSAGIIWRWTASTAAYVGTLVGDVLLVENVNFNVGNRTDGIYGDGRCSFFPIVSVDTSNTWIEVQNPFGIAEGPITLGNPVNMSVSLAFFIEWKHRLDLTATMKVESIGFSDMFRYSWISGATPPLWAQSGVSVDDYVVVSGNSFLPGNRGMFRIVAVADSYFVVENVLGSEEVLVNIDLPIDVRFFYSESMISGDSLNVSDTSFLASNRGSFPTTNFGTDTTVSYSAVEAIWQSGNTVRYTTPTVGILTGYSVTFTGFANPSNNGTFPVTKTSGSNWIEVTSARANATDDETGVIGATVTRVSSKTQYVTVTISNSSGQANVVLSGLPNTFFVTDGQLFSSYREITNFSADPSDLQSAIVYISPAMNSSKMSNAFNTYIKPVQKFSFPSNTSIGVDGYRYYTGLLATVQKTVDGYDPDPVNFPGYKAAGTQIEPVPPLIEYVSVNVIVTTSGGVGLSVLSDAIKSAILNYIQGLGVGDDVIVSEITTAVMSVEGVESATLFDPDPAQERIVIQDNQKAVINIDSITVSSG